MTDFISIEVDEDEVMHGLDIQERWAKHILKDFIDDLADKGVEILSMHAPKPGVGHPYSEGGIQERIDRTGVQWVGAPTTGAFMVVLGIKAGVSRYPVYVNEGTGLYSYTGDYIRSHSGRAMWFYATRIGDRIGRFAVRGQRPQHFLYETWRDLGIFAEFRLIGERFLLEHGIT